MEPRFGASFGSVRVHDDAGAATFARRFAARAYTVGEHVVFAAGEYQPHGDGGRRLIAHELAHVLQQRGASPGGPVQRTPDPTTFRCQPFEAGGPATPFADLEVIDQRAQGLATSMAILGTASSVLNPANSTRGYDVAYQTRFGTPQRIGTQFRNRFSGQLKATEEEAAQEEISEIADRFSRIADFLAGDVTYRCKRQGVSFTHGGCTSVCGANDVAITCVPNDARIIAICPSFWGLTDDAQRAGAIIHEGAHMRLNFPGHGSGSRTARGNNPECYTSMAADVFNWTPFDRRCPPI
jgi:hypothetical protein